MGKRSLFCRADGIQNYFYVYSKWNRRLSIDFDFRCLQISFSCNCSNWLRDLCAFFPFIIIFFCILVVDKSVFNLCSYYVISAVCDEIHVFFFSEIMTLPNSFHLFVMDFMVLNHSLFYLFNTDLSEQRIWVELGQKRRVCDLYGKGQGTGSSGKLRGRLEVMQGENGKSQSPARPETWLLP